MYMESCVFVSEDFPKENQKLANEQLITKRSCWAVPATRTLSYLL